MKTRHVILSAICCVPLFSGCASNQSAGVKSWTIKPTAHVRHSSDKPEALYQLGRYYQGQNRHELAIAAYLRALAADAGFVEARNGLGVVYAMQGRYDEAIEALKAAAQQAPSASHIYSNLGYAYYARGLYPESIAALEQATALNPANQRALNNLGLAFAKAGSPGGATLALAKAASAQGTAAAEAAPQDTAAHGHAIAAARYVAPSAPGAAPAAASSPQTLTPPAAGGITIQANAGTPVPVAESRMKVVRVAPNVYELRERLAAATHAVAAIRSALVDVKPGAGKLRVEVSNGNGVTGMARKVDRFLHGGSYPIARLTNQKPFQVKLTQIQYRDGYQAQAQRLQSSLPGQPAMILSNDMRADIGVRLVLGRDIARNVAYFDGRQGQVRLAQNKAGAD